MFLCSKCKATISLPVCSKCGNEYKQLSGVWQLSDMPDMVVGGDNDKYIGYEHIGENYSGNRKYVIEDKDLAVAKEIVGLTGDGVFLDLACGDGCFTVPVASSCLMVRENTAMITINTNDTGIIILENDSIPLFTPRKTTNAVATRKMTVNIIGSTFPVINPVK